MNSESSSLQAYGEILRGLKGEELTQLQALKQLSTIFGASFDQNLFPISEMAPLLIKILASTQSEQILVLASLCICKLLDSSRSYEKSFSEVAFVQSLADKLKQGSSKGIEYFIHIISIFVDRKPERIGQLLGVHTFLNFFNMVPLASQRECMQTIATLTARFVVDKFNEQLKPLLDIIITTKDPIIRQYAIASFTNISTKIQPSLIPVNVLSPLANSIPYLNDNITAIAFMKIVYRASKDPVAVSQLLLDPPNFERLLFSEIATINVDVCQQILEVVQIMIAPPQMPKGLWSAKNRPNPKSEEFTVAIEPVLVKFLINKNTCEQTAVQLLAACSTISPLEPTKDFLTVLLRHARMPRRAAHVLVIALHFDSKDLVERSGLLEVLRATNVVGTAKEWYKKSIENLANFCADDRKPLPELTTPAEIAEHAKSMLPYEFFHSGYLTRDDLPVDDATLIDLAFGVLEFLPYPKDPNPLRIANLPQFTRKEIPFSIVTKFGTIPDASSSILGDFMAVEGWYNQTYYKDAKVEHFDELFEVPKDLATNPMRFAIFARAANVAGYHRCSFKIAGVTFSVYDSIAHAVSVACPDPDKLQRFRVSMEIIEEDSRRSHFQCPAFTPGDMGNALLYLAKCHPSHFSALFAQQMMANFAQPLPVVCLYSNSVRLAYAHPYILPFKERRFIFSCVALDTNTAAKLIHDRYHANAEEGLISFSHTRCTVRRSHIFEDGCRILDTVGRGRIHIDVIFQGEPGLGEGPTQEFFALMGRAFCEKAHGLWRDDQVAADGYCWTQLGLFPSVTADEKLLELFGVLCGKALLMSKIVDLPLNPAFLRKVIGEEISLADVDPVVARSLSSPIGLVGMEFTYPGCPDRELVPDGANVFVDEDNLDEYVRLIQDRTVGDGIASKIDAFRRGLETNVAVDALRLMTGDEIRGMICGEDVGITYEDLKNEVLIKHGYDESSPEVANLFDVIMEMNDEERQKLVQFITGCSRLPVGGLANLTPRLTIAKRVCEPEECDLCLPSVMTCTNYFKLPPYSSKEVTRTKLLQAIYECQETFQFS